MQEYTNFKTYLSYYRARKKSFDVTTKCGTRSRVHNCKREQQNEIRRAQVRRQAMNNEHTWTEVKWTRNKIQWPT